MSRKTYKSNWDAKIAWHVGPGQPPTRSQKTPYAKKCECLLQTCMCASARLCMHAFIHVSALPCTSKVPLLLLIIIIQSGKPRSPQPHWKRPSSSAHPQERTSRLLLRALGVILLHCCQQPSNKTTTVTD